MTLRQNVQFRSGFPDDADYDLDVQPGRNIADALKAALSRRGYRVSEPINGGDHGWELDVWRGASASGSRSACLPLMNAIS